MSKTFKLLPMMLLGLLVSAPVSTPAAAQNTQPAVEGTYDLVITESSMGPERLTLVIEREGEALRARSTSEGPLSITSIAVNGESVVLRAMYEREFPIDLPGRLTTEGGMRGRWSIEGFGGTWSAKRKPAEQ
jgi:hypothetical protein